MARTKSKSKDSANEIQVFEEFTTDEVKVISKYSEKKYYQRDEVVFQEDSKDASLYVVLSGQLKVYAHTKDKQRIHLSDIDAGEVFGELSFLDSKPRSATILAFNDVELLEVTREQFDMLRDNYPSIASKLILDLARVVSLRLRNADKFIVEISQILNNQKPEKVKAEKPATSKPAKVKTEKAVAVKPEKVKAEKSATSKPAKVKTEKAVAIKPEKVKAEKSATPKPAKVKTEKVATVKLAKVKVEKSVVTKPAKTKAAKAKKSKIAYIAPKKPKKK